VFLFRKGFEMGKVDKTLFLLKQGDDILIVQVYVNVIIFGGSSHSLVVRFAEDMSKEFEMSMMGELQFILELQIKHAKEGTFVHQAKYMKEILKKFKIDDLKPLSTSMNMTTVLDADEDREPVDQKEYQSMIASLLYFTAMRPGIQFLCVCALVFRYHRGLHIGMPSSGSSSISIHSGAWSLVLSILFPFASWFFGCRLCRVSSTYQFLGSSLVSWSSRKQSSVAQSTIEAEYVVAANCCSQLLWITYTLSDFGEECSHVPLMCDSTSAISVAKSHVLHSRTKHIEVRYHFLRDNVEKGNIDLIHVPTEKRLVDILIMPLDQTTFARLRGVLGVIFPFRASVGRVDVHMHIAFSFM
jgi:hypothetical protein